MSLFAWIILAAIGEALLSLTSGVLLLWQEKRAKRFLHWFVSFAAGALLGVAFFDLLPEAFAEASPSVLLPAVLIGIVAFFLIEHSMLWYHCHHGQHAELPLYTTTVIFGDALHNFLDGIAITVSFLVSIPLGVVTTGAILLHELPQEISDFSLMLHAGMEKRRIFWINLVISFTTVLGAALTYLFSHRITEYLPIFLGLTGGAFLYIALSDLIPELHKERSRMHLFMHSILFLFGLAAIAAVGKLVPE